MRTIRTVDRSKFFANNRRAILKLMEYSADDSCDCARLEKFLRACAAGDVEAAAAQGCEVLRHYVACDIFIDELNEDCKSLCGF